MAALSSRLYEGDSDERGQKENEVEDEETIREWVIAFYKEHNPEKLNAVDTILAKFKGKEEELVRQLERKYRVSEEYERIRILEEALDQSEHLKLREQREKEDALTRLRQIAAAEQVESRRNVELLKVVKHLDAVAACAAADAATAALALKEREEALVNLASRQQELSAHLIASSVSNDDSFEAAEINSICSTSKEINEYKALYLSTKQELAGLALRYGESEARCIQLSAERAEAIHELGQANRRFDAVTGSAEDSRALVEDLKTEAMREATAKKCAEEKVFVQNVRLLELEKELEEARSEINSIKAARSELLTFCTTERDRLESETKEALHQHAEQYLALQEDMLAANNEMNARLNSLCAVRLHNANIEINRLTLALDQTKRERDAAFDTRQQLEAQLERAADRIVHAEHLLNANSYTNGPLPSSTSSKQLLQSLLDDDNPQPSPCNAHTPELEASKSPRHHASTQSPLVPSSPRREAIPIASTPLLSASSVPKAESYFEDISASHREPLQRQARDLHLEK